MMTSAGAKKLISDCKRTLQKGESRTRILKSISNLSKANLETAILCAQHVLTYGTWEGTLMPPCCEVAELLSKY